MTKRRTYTKEFKIEAVELADKIDNSAQAERDPGIPHGQIYKWCKKLNEEGEPEKAFPGKGNVRDAKMKALKRRLDRLEEEDAILEKAMGIFSTVPVEKYPHYDTDLSKTIAGNLPSAGCVRFSASVGVDIASGAGGKAPKAGVSRRIECDRRQLEIGVLPHREVLPKRGIAFGIIIRVAAPVYFVGDEGGLF